MKLFYTDMPTTDFRKNIDSIFLAGPSPRNDDVKSWRPEALELLAKFGYEGQIFVPEWSKPSSKDNRDNFDYIDQTTWENFGTENCNKIMFWIPRDLKIFPAFTTNVEFGRYIPQANRTVFYGRPDDAPNNKYLDWL